jgi:hypothetical protein
MIFVGEPADIIPLSFGKDPPAMREWVPRHFDFAGYVMGEHPCLFGSRSQLRQALGYSSDERVCIVTRRRFRRRHPFDQAHPAGLAGGERLRPYGFALWRRFLSRRRLVSAEIARRSLV